MCLSVCLCEHKCLLDHTSYVAGLEYHQKTTTPCATAVRRCSCDNADFYFSIEHQTDRQTDRCTSHMARCVTFAVARIRVGNRRNFAYFPSSAQSMGDRRSKKAYTGPRTGIYLPTKFGCDRSIVVGCRSRNDRQTSRQTNRMV